MDRTFKWAFVVFFLLLATIPMVATYFSELRRKHLEAEDRLASQNVSVPPIENEWIFIPAGDFLMGSDDGAPDEKPERRVRLSPYLIQKYEVTVHEYMEFVRITSHRSPLTVRDNANRPFFDHPNKPIVYVSWDDATDYCKWIGGRLPTEAEWEKAARGITGRKWPWGNEARSNAANLSGEEDRYRYTAPVGALDHDVSPFGLYDMGGNAREWVSDWYGERYYSTAPSENPKGPLEGDNRVLRGGSWNDTADLARTTARMKMFPDYRDMSIGFRCAKDLREGPTNKAE